MSINDSVLLRDNELRKLLSFLKINKTAKNIDLTLLGIRDIESTLKRAKKTWL